MLQFKQHWRILKCAKNCKTMMSLDKVRNPKFNHSLWFVKLAVHVNHHHITDMPRSYVRWFLSSTVCLYLYAVCIYMNRDICCILYMNILLKKKHWRRCSLNIFLRGGRVYTIGSIAINTNCGTTIYHTPIFNWLTSGDKIDCMEV